MVKIENEGQLISIIYRNEDWVKGLNFITPDEMFVQVGSWWYDKGKKLDSIFNLASSEPIWGPPPCTTTGFIPTDFISTMSLAK